jgi:hypothetical protein
VKLLIALDVLGSEGWQPDPGTTAQVQRMLSASDDDIADALWESHGGSAIITRTSGLIGLNGTRPPGDPTQWGETLTTARDVVSMYRYLTTAVPDPARTVILGALHSVSRIAADGTDQYFGIPAALPGTNWAVKPGWMSLDTSTVMDSTGLVGRDPIRPLRYIVAVLTSQPADVSWTTGGSAVTAGVSVLRNVIR